MIDTSVRKTHGPKTSRGEGPRVRGERTLPIRYCTLVSVSARATAAGSA